MTSLSYVVSLLPADLVRDLRLASHGYHVFPQGPYFAPRADGRYLRLPPEPAARRAEIAKFSALDAAAYDRYEAHLAGIGAILGPMLAEIPPRLGSRRPPDLWRQGLLSPTSASPSVFDDSLAPAGQHVMSMFTQWVPHGYADKPDDAALAAYADRVIARVEAVAPGFTDSILHRQVIGSHQMQEEYGLVGGNIFHGELSLGQMFHGRPAAGYADLRTPVRGLYQAGSATHGGGGVTGIPGRNVVRQIMADRRAARWRRRERA